MMASSELIPQPGFFNAMDGCSGEDSSLGQLAMVHLLSTYYMLSPELLEASGRASP